MNKKKNKAIRNLLYYGLPVLAVATLLILWILFSKNNPKLMPTPVQVVQRLIRTFEVPIAKTSIFGHAWASLSRILLAFAAAWPFGIIFGVLCGWNKSFNAIFGTIFEVFRPIPPMAWIPLIILWFGIGETSKVLIVFISTFIPISINTAAGIQMVDKINISVGTVFGGNSRQILFDIVIPTALPSIFAGIRTSVSIGWGTVLAAEMMGAQKGLGALVTRGWQGGDMALVLVAVITIALIGFTLTAILNKLEKELCPWTVEK